MGAGGYVREPRAHGCHHADRRVLPNRLFKQLWGVGAVLEAVALRSRLSAAAPRPRAFFAVGGERAADLRRARRSSASPPKVAAARQPGAGLGDVAGVQSGVAAGLVLLGNKGETVYYHQYVYLMGVP